MSATPPSAPREYSRGPRAFWQGFARLHGAKWRIHAPAATPGGGTRAWVLGGTLVSAALLVGAEFTTLFQVRIAAHLIPIKSVTTGSHHAYALILVAVLALALAYGAFAHQPRPALLAMGALALVALLIVLARDLPDAHASGIVGSGARGYRNAMASPSTGFYLETLGAILLLLTSGSGLLLATPSRTGGAPPSAS